MLGTFIAHLSRNGKYGYFWTAPAKRTIWWSVNEPAPVPNGRQNIYFGVHPTAAIPETNSLGEARDPEHVRGRNEHIAAVNCLFAEFDAKDFSSKAEALAHVKTLTPLPSVVIDSGGGYHCYWLLYESFVIDSDERRQRAADVQAAWVERAGGDPGAKDLARVLRVPGTTNYKPAYEPDFPPVSFVEADFQRLYDFDTLAGMVEHLIAPKPEPVNRESIRINGGSTAYAQAALEQETNELAATQAGMRNARLNKAAFSLGQLVAGGYLTESEVKRALEHACQQNGLIPDDGQGKFERTLQSGLASGKQKPRSIPREPLPAQTGAKDKKASSNKSKSKPKPMKDTILDLALAEDITLFVDQHNKVYCRTPRNGHYEILPVDGGTFGDWLGWLLYRHDGRTCSDTTLDPARRVLRAKAKFEEKSRHRLANRTAWSGDSLYIDASDDQWRTFKITSEGWQIDQAPPILFRRYAHQMPQVTPEKVSLDEVPEVLNKVFEFVNLNGEDERLIFMVYLVSLFIPEIAHPIPVLHGEQGSGKTFALKTIRALVDPSAVSTLSLPWKSDEFVQQLDHHWCSFYDNLNSLSEWQQDVICRAVTGEGHSKRELYSDDEDVIYTYRRCIALNGINVVASRPDLLDRSILLELDTLNDSRKTEAELTASFEQLRPRLLGAILEILVGALQGDAEQATALATYFRLADWTAWGWRIAEAMGERGGEFVNAYAQATQSKAMAALELHPLGKAMQVFMADQDVWEGTPKTLLDELEEVAEAEGINADKTPWPGSASWIGRRLKEVKPDLRTAGITYTDDHDGTQRIYTVTKT